MNRRSVVLTMVVLLVVSVVVLIPGSPVGATHPGSNGLLAFSQNRAAQTDVWVMSLDGSGLFNLTDSPATQSDPAWSPDGRYLAYTAFGNYEGAPVVIRIWDSQLDLTEEFAPLAGKFVLRPTWSPDGGQLAFEVTDDFAGYDIWIADIDGGSPFNLTNGGWNRYPDWSPDGTKIAYTGMDRHQDIFTINVDGTGRTNLTNQYLGDLSPSWSPDGTRILFESQRDWNVEFYANYELYTMAADGSNVSRLTHSTNNNTQASWSPDGSNIAYVSQVDNDPSQAQALGPMKLYVMNADGSAQQLLVGDEESYTHAPSWGQTPNSPPVAIDDEAHVDRGGQIEIPVLANDTDGDNDPLHVTIETAPASGSLTRIGPGTFMYGHDGSTSPASDSFQYRVTDWEATDTATVSITVWAGFDDVPEANTFFRDIRWLGSSGITRGCNPPLNTMFCPDNNVTRGQMAAFLVRALNLPQSTSDWFTDDDDSIFQQDIDRLANAGITRGCNPPLNTKYCPDNHVTRGQMAAFLVRAFGLSDSASLDVFVDDDESVFEGDIEILAAAGVTRGCNPPVNSMYCPTGLVTRSQMAAFLHRACDLPPTAVTRTCD